MTGPFAGSCPKGLTCFSTRTLSSVFAGHPAGPLSASIRYAINPSTSRTLALSAVKRPEYYRDKLFPAIGPIFNLSLPANPPQFSPSRKKPACIVSPALLDFVNHFLLTFSKGNRPRCPRPFRKDHLISCFSGGCCSCPWPMSPTVSSTPSSSGRETLRNN